MPQGKSSREAAAPKARDTAHGRAYLPPHAFRDLSRDRRRLPHRRPQRRRAVVQREGETILFDCGEGTQRQMMRYGVGFSFHEVFFTHYHADHMLGITGLLRTMGLQDRTAPVTLYGPRGAARILTLAVNLGIERNKFPVEIVELQPGDRLSAGRVRHRRCSRPSIAPTPWATPSSSTFASGGSIPERARELGVPEGPLWGRLHKGEAVTLEDGRTVTPADLVGPPRPRPDAGLHRRHAAVAGGDRGGARRGPAGARGHVRRATRRSGRWRPGTPPRPRRRGSRSRPVCGGWCSPTSVPRYTRDAPELLAEARAVFPETTIARDGMVVDVPVADGEVGESS